MPIKSIFINEAAYVEGVSTELSTEISNRISGDSSLSTTVSTEVSTRGGADTSLSTALSTELSVRGSAVTSLSTIISTEISTRGGADTSLSTAISSSTSGVSSLSTVISTEISTRGSADTSLSTALSAEASTRVAADSSLSTAVSTEVSTRGAADTSLSTAISTEASSRTSADASLASAISSGGGSSYLSGLTDVTITSLTNNDLLVYSGSTWVNKPNVSNLWSVSNSSVTLVNTDYNLELSSIQIQQDGGARILSDMTVTSASTSGTENSYAMRIDENSVFRIYSESDGSGGLTLTGIVLDGDYYYAGNPKTDGSWRWFINTSGDLEFQKRISGVWTYKNKMT